MSKFLRVALNFSTFSSHKDFKPISSNSTWCFSSAFPDPIAYETFDALFLPETSLQLSSRPTTRLWKAEVDSEDAEDFAFLCNSMQFDSVDASYTFRDLHDVISSSTRNDLYLDSRVGDLKSDFEMVCRTCPFVRLVHSVILAFGPGTTPKPPIEFPRFSSFCFYAKLCTNSDRARYNYGHRRNLP